MQCLLQKSREFSVDRACSQCRRFLYGHFMSLNHCGTLLVEEPNSPLTWVWCVPP
ncbi:hypothetical protein FQN60_008726 [Etheostoma spectabile]|uniref:Uncharacterized protein n=1 Tax=Etheostoma spectabile TaxID=54343 RepID=A0A5J5CMX5_9PERO|nr:hypothetical protein FQN60_008726 [Etheostoma spectabile]